jgi:putative hydrolase of the HAD superfamily
LKPLPASFVHRDLCAAGITDLVSAVIASSEVGWRKPNTAGFMALAQKLRTTPDRMLFVGNEAKDVAGACRAGARGIFLDHDGSGEDYGQHGTIRRLDDLLGFAGLA